MNPAIRFVISPRTPAARLILLSPLHAGLAHTFYRRKTILVEANKAKITAQNVQENSTCPPYRLRVPRKNPTTSRMIPNSAKARYVPRIAAVVACVVCVAVRVVSVTERLACPKSRLVAASVVRTARRACDVARNVRPPPNIRLLVVKEEARRLLGTVGTLALYAANDVLVVGTQTSWRAVLA